MDDMETICFQIISFSGTAKSKYLCAIEAAKENRMEEARSLMKEGKEIFLNAHRVHADMLGSEANGNCPQIGILLIHAEDQLMAAETVEILAGQMIGLYGELASLKQN